MGVGVLVVTSLVIILVLVLVAILVAIPNSVLQMRCMNRIETLGVICCEKKWSDGNVRFLLTCCSPSELCPKYLERLGTDWARLGSGRGASHLL